MNTASAVPIIVVLVASLFAGVMDVWKFRVPNALTVPLLFTGMVYHGWMGGLPGVRGSALGVLFGGGALILLYAMGGLGAGDVKVMAGVGAWFGMPMTFYVFLASSLAGGLYALVLLALQGKVSETWVSVQIMLYRFGAIGHHLGADVRVEDAVNRADRRRRCVPFAAMVAVGVIASLVWVYWVE